MRLLLDADLSFRRIAGPLTERGFDVVAAQADAVRRSLPDAEILVWAAAESRILVTRNARHFQPLVRLWAERPQSHAGVILIWTLRSNQFNEIVDAIERLFADRPNQESWRDLVLSI